MMEKGSSTPNRLTRSSTRNTPSKKSENSSELNPAEELKHNLRKSRRKTETKLSANGDSLNDVDTKKQKHCDEVSEGNSLDGCDSEDSSVGSVHKNISQSNKVSSPTISRRSLRSRSITPGPELEPIVNRKIRRSTSESKLDSIHTLTNRRRTRAKSESKDFVFSPSKNDNSDYEKESNSKCVPINSDLRVLDGIIEEDNELETRHESPKPSFTTLKTVEVETDDNVVLKGDKEENICQNENFKSDSKEYNVDLPVTKVNEHLTISEEAEDDEKAVGIANETTDYLEISADSVFAQETSNQLSSVEEIVVIQEATNQKVDNIIETGDQCPSPRLSCNEYNPDVLVAEVSDNLPVKEEAKGEKYNVDSPSKRHCHLMSSNSDSITKSNNQLSALEKANDMQETSNQEVDISKETNDMQETSNQEVDISKETGDLSKETGDLSKETSDLSKETGDQCSTPQLVSNENTPAVILAEVHDHLPIPEESEGNKCAVDTAIEREDKFLIPADSELNNQFLAEEEVDAAQETINQDVYILKERGDQLSMSVSTEPSKKSSDQLQTSEETESIQETSFQLPISEEITSNKLSKEANADLQSDGEIIKNVQEKSNCHAEHFGNVNSLNNDVLFKNDENHRLNIKTDESLTKCIEIDDSENEKELNNITITDVQSIKDFKAVSDNCSLESTQLEISTTGPENVPITENNNISLMLEVESEYEDSVPPNQNPALTNKVTSESLSDSPPKSLIMSEIGTKSSQSYKFEADENSRLNKNNMLDSYEDKDSASDSELYKNMSDFGSDIDEKKDGSQYGDSASTELRSGDSDEYVSSFEGEVDEEETNNEENQPSNDQGNSQDNHKSIKKTPVAGNDFDSGTPITYDKALAMINKNRVKKIDDEEFFDLFTKELNRVSEESGSDSDIAIVDEYIAEPEEKQQSKSNQKTGNPEANVKNPKRPTPPMSVSQRPMPPPGAYNKKIPMQLQRINLKSTKKSDSSPNSVSNNFSETNNQQAQTGHIHPSMARMTFSQEELYHQYNQTMPSMDPNMGPYDQYAPPYFVPDNFSRGMYGHPLGPVSDTQMHYSSGSPLKVRNIDTMCGSHPSNAMNLNSVHFEQGVNSFRNETDYNQVIGVSASTMTESGEKQEKRASNTSSSKKVITVTSPILEMLGLDKKKLKMLKNVLGLNESRDKQRAKIKQILIEEAHKMGISFKSPEKIKNQNQREQKARKKHLVEQITDSHSDSGSSSLQSSTVHSSEESNELTSSVSKKSQSSSESSNENEAETRTVNVEDRGVCVTIDTRPKRKLRHRTIKDIPMLIVNTNKRKCNHQSSESNDEENVKETVEKKFRHRKKMTQGKKQNKKQPTILQSNCGTFVVDPVVTTSQSESESQQEDSTNCNITEEEQIRAMKEDLAAGKNKLSNMFRLHSLKEEKKSLKRKVDSIYDQSEEMEPKATKSKRLPAHLLAKLGGEERKSKRQKRDQTSESELEELPRQTRKPRKRAISKKLRVSSTAAKKHYIPLVMAGPTQFGLQRLDKDGTLSSVEKAAKFRSDQLYGSSVKRITIMDFEG